MSASAITTLCVSKLRPGMVLHHITKQKGKLVVKHKGRIKHKSVIKQLIACGVREVAVEVTQSSFKSEVPAFSKFEAANDPLGASAESLDLSSDIPSSKLNNSSAASDAAIELDDEPSELSAEDVKLASSNEIEFPAEKTPLAKPTSTKGHNKAMSDAEQLVIDCKNLYGKVRVEIEKGVAVDFSEAKQIVSNVYAALRENPDALLCLSMIRNEGDYLTNHAMHCAILLCYFGQYLGMSENDCKRLSLLGYFFDIGMVKVPKSILHKQGRPTPDEQAIIQTHVRYSIELLAPLELDNQLSLAIEQHHERLNGTGYPNALSGEQIQKFSRMLAIVDCYEAMTTNRPFQKKSSPAAALKLITTKEYGYDLKLALQFVRAMGVYPIGSLVILNNKHIAMVDKNHTAKALLPIVKSFYNIDSGDYTDVQTIDLAAPKCSYSILKPTLAEHYRLDLDRVVFD